ncbi:unnamed protein product [Protopolystoma xenopodis]|uniref:Uncharacterized protein n=1 Tax=Protopolystoma xenopodis TaxID=117903 RepID=A0A3S5AGN2_9PLAT|nr:unnamed protein product [Protopolystoma xenopodis]
MLNSLLRGVNTNSISGLPASDLLLARANGPSPANTANCLSGLLSGGLGLPGSQSTVTGANASGPAVGSGIGSTSLELTGPTVTSGSASVSPSSALSSSSMLAARLAASLLPACRVVAEEGGSTNNLQNRQQLQHQQLNQQTQPTAQLHQQQQTNQTSQQYKQQQQQQQQHQLLHLAAQQMQLQLNQARQKQQQQQSQHPRLPTQQIAVSQQQESQQQAQSICSERCPANELTSDLASLANTYRGVFALESDIERAANIYRNSASKQICQNHFYS